MIGLVDTNLFKKLTKNTNGIHDSFIQNLGHTATELDWAVAPFGLLEYLGLRLRGKVEVPSMTVGWKPPKEILSQYARAVEAFGEEFVASLYWVRHHARNHFENTLTEKLVSDHVKLEASFHSTEFRSGPLHRPLFADPIADLNVSDVAELLSIDYLHRYQGFPNHVDAPFRAMNRTAVLAEHYTERRNVVLFRCFKSVWNQRQISPDEASVSAETMSKISTAMSRLKNNADRFDHDLLGFFLLGFFSDSSYRPIHAFTQDDPEEVLNRLVVFRSVIESTWTECSDIEGVESSAPFQMASVFSFVDDLGAITEQITAPVLVRYLHKEKLVKPIATAQE